MFLDTPLSLPASSSVAFFTSPVHLVQLGPDLETALQELIAFLTHHVSDATDAPLTVITFSWRTIGVIFSNKEPQNFVCLRLRLHGDRIQAQELPDQQLTKRIVTQLCNINKRQPTIDTPFRCSEDWQGYGPREHRIYEQMVTASRSPEQWKDLRLQIMGKSLQHD